MLASLHWNRETCEELLGVAAWKPSSYTWIKGRSHLKPGLSAGFSHCVINGLWPGSTNEASRALWTILNISKSPKKKKNHTFTHGKGGKDSRADANSVVTPASSGWSGIWRASAYGLINSNIRKQSCSNIVCLVEKLFQDMGSKEEVKKNRK